jgi:dynein heavy chain
MKTFQGISELDEKYKEGVVKLCVDMQQRVRELSSRLYQEVRQYYYVTPTSYLELLSTFKRLLGARIAQIKGLISGYETGLEKIKKAEEDVNVMKIELNELKPILQVKTEENLKMLQNLQKEQKKADNDRLICESEERECNLQREQANQMKDDCQKDLDQVLPILNKAVKSLENLSRDDITKIKSYTKPPTALDYVMQGLCIILGEDNNVKMKPKEPGSMEKIQDFWEHSKKYVLNEKLLRRIDKFRDDQIKAIPPQKVIKLKHLINDKEFETEKIFNASEAAGNLAEWIRACIMTYDALLVVEPKRLKLF